MKNRVVPVLMVFCVLLLVLILRPFLVPANAQAPTASETGRYSLVFNAGAEYFTDTKTGQIWVNEAILRDTKDGPSSFVGMHWVEVDSPVSKVTRKAP